jgi:hypothetical protein
MSFNSSVGVSEAGGGAFVFLFGNHRAKFKVTGGSKLDTCEKVVKGWSIGGELCGGIRFKDVDSFD